MVQNCFKFIETMRQILNLSTVELASINFGSIGQIEILRTIICIWPFKKMCTVVSHNSYKKRQLLSSILNLQVNTQLPKLGFVKKLVLLTCNSCKYMDTLNTIFIIKIEIISQIIRKKNNM